MRALAALLLAACLVSAAPYDQIDCWAVRDSIASAEVGADTVALGGQVMGWCLYNASADTQVRIGFGPVAADSVTPAYMSVALAAWSPMFACGVEGTYATETLYIFYADSAGVGDPVYILCYGRKD